MRYAIDNKPKYYVSFKTNEETGKKFLYITEDYYEEIKNQIVSHHKEDWYAKKTRPPEYLLDAIYYSYSDYASSQNYTVIEYTEDEINQKWWDITEWAEYYKEIFGDYPNERLSNYGQEGAIFSCTFPGGAYIEVRTEKPTGMKYYYNDGTDRVRSLFPLLIFDTFAETGDPFYYQYKSPYSKATITWDPFQHGF